ncbi:hypothetical protein [uncultured Tenacibaculum sp.]|uniref:hypothetical protein n=1 Tax=uncultured Tenacibaculum sp. TaxID=174713 RepID=UPI002638DBBB|nr:hypothetical protein [uncultured Tenacibaculum sp.]
MNKELIIQTKRENYEFKFYEEVWISNIINELGNFSIEVYKDTLDQNKLGKVLKFIESETLLTILKRSEALLQLLAINFWGEDYKGAEFNFQGIIISANVDEELVDFQLCFHMSSALNDFDDFANWIVDMKNSKITGVKREQL